MVADFRQSLRALTAVCVAFAVTSGSLAHAQLGGGGQAGGGMGGMGGGMMGGGMGGMGGGMGGMGVGAAATQFAWIPREPQAPFPLSAAAARTWLALSKRVDIPFSEETPLKDVLAFIKEAANKKEAKDGEIEIYVDPMSLQEAEKTFDSPITYAVKGRPLTSSLTMMLKQLGLTYYVQKDGLLTIVCPEIEKLQPNLAVPVSAAAAKTWLRLYKPVDLVFDGSTPLGDALQLIKNATAEENDELSIYVDPVALAELEKTLDTPISINLKRVPAGKALTLITRQIGMTYRVDDDGLITISSKDKDFEGSYPQMISHLRAELEEAKLEAQITELRAKARATESGETGGGKNPQ